mmetsp:Transcript_26626/g.42333  ORF Transcript_26626/g.42333 Transcript_26626/m.42333 type:complete len:86 (-) Transcript_26626:48-305(-)
MACGNGSALPLRRVILAALRRGVASSVRSCADKLITGCPEKVRLVGASICGKDDVYSFMTILYCLLERLLFECTILAAGMIRGCR